MSNAQTLKEEMAEIWADDPNQLYNEWHNAVRRAKEFWSATRLYVQEHDGEPGAVYEMPDGSKVWIHFEGFALETL